MTYCHQEWESISTRANVELYKSWNHMQMDGVGLWGTTREIHDDNPPLVPYKEVKSPPQSFPKILSIPKVAGQAVKRGSLYKGVLDSLHTGQANGRANPFEISRRN